MHLPKWIIVLYFLMYKIYIQRIKADGRVQIHFQLWEPSDFRPESICCPTDRSNVQTESSQSSISLVSTPCVSSCDLYIDFCLGTQNIAQTFNATRDCRIGKNIFRLDHNFEWNNSKLSGLEFPIQGRLPPMLTIILQILRRNNPRESSESWTLLVQTVFYQSEIIPSENWTIHRREIATTELAANETLPVSDRSPHLVLHVRLKCEPNFYGPDCAQFCQPMRGPHGNFICEQDTGARQCVPGWRGERCTEAICDPPCIHGTCVRPNYCKCRSGWQGLACDQCQVYPGCVHGNCERNVTTNAAIPFTCECHSGWGGMLCDVDLQYCQRHERICENNGLCVNTRSRSELFHRCVCPPQFYGRHCEKKMIGCGGTGCGVHGTCHQSDNGTHVCQCRDGYCGSTCQLTGVAHCGLNSSTDDVIPLQQKNDSLISTDSTLDRVSINCTEETCVNGGICKILDNHQMVCECSPGFAGPKCDLLQTNQTNMPDTTKELISSDFNVTHTVTLNTITFFSSFYRSSLMFFLLAFVLLLICGILAHCIHSHQQSNPRYAHQSQLVYPHISNNLAQIVHNPMTANYPGKTDNDWTGNNHETAAVFASKYPSSEHKWHMLRHVIKWKRDHVTGSFPTSHGMFHKFQGMSNYITQPNSQTGWLSGQIKPFSTSVPFYHPPDRSSSV